MLRLKNVSKFYYSNGVISSGFTKVNLELEKGEFVAITGESGSGKSTLLNVISGLDTYEEGEMYINGEETSAYSNADFENYRRKYIANIYQSFNLINSYTVYQNVEMVLLLSKLKRRERRARIMDILKKVDLYKFRHQRASRLSGGQKQRVAIARALVKDTPIIVADEPTGNLDTAAAANVIELLSQLASDKLVVVVTHNYEQVEPYVTRKITMHDGRITEDLKIDHPRAATGAPAEEGSEDVKQEAAPQRPVAEAREGRKHLNIISRVRLGIRNTFNLIPKFLLLLFIFLFVSASVTSLYANIRESKHNMSMQGYNYFFNNTDEKRIVIKKSDKSPISAEDFEALAALDNVDSIFRDDVLLDTNISLQCEENEKWYYFSGRMVDVGSMGLTDEDLTYGRMPTEPNEVVVIGNKNHYNNNEETAADMMTVKFQLWVNTNYSSESMRDDMVVTGFLFKESDDYNYTIGAYPEVFDSVKRGINSSFSSTTVRVAGQEFKSDPWAMANKVVPSNRVSRGCAMVSSDWNYFWEWQWAPGQYFSVTVSNLYYTDTKSFYIEDIYYQWNFTEKTGYSDYNWNNGVILVNSQDYYDFFDKDCYQSSVFVKDPEKVRTTISALEEMGYEPLYLQDALMNYDRTWMVMNDIFNTLWSSGLVLVLFFISYFIVKLIMKSRNVYYATVRMLGGSAGDCRSLIRIELLIILNLAFFIMAGAIYASYLGYYQYDFVDVILKYLTLKDYAILYAVLNLMALIISSRYSRQLFKTSAMNVYKEV